MNILELQEQRLNLQQELTNIVNQAETRSLEENENARLAEIRSQIDSIDEQIAEIEKENKQIELNNQNNKKEKKMKMRII